MGMKSRDSEYIQVDKLIRHLGPERLQRGNGVIRPIEKRVAKPEEITGLQRVGFVAHHGSQRASRLFIIGAVVFDETDVKPNAGHLWIEFLRFVKFRESLIPALATHGDNAKVGVSCRGSGIQLQNLAKSGLCGIKVITGQRALATLKDHRRIRL